MACVTTNDRAIEHVYTIPVALTFSDHINSFADCGPKYLGGMYPSELIAYNILMC